MCIFIREWCTRKQNFWTLKTAFSLNLLLEWQYQYMYYNFHTLMHMYLYLCEYVWNSNPLQRNFLEYSSLCSCVLRKPWPKTCLRKNYICSIGKCVQYTTIYGLENTLNPLHLRSIMCAVPSMTKNLPCMYVYLFVLRNNVNKKIVFEYNVE